MMPTPQQLGYGASTCAAIVGGIYWLLKRWRINSIYRIFIRDMATNHLPHVYTALELIGDKVGADIPNHPKIKFLDEKDFEG